MSSAASEDACATRPDRADNVLPALATDIRHVRDSVDHVDSRSAERLARDCFS